MVSLKMNLAICLYIFLCFHAVHANEIDVTREETDYHIGRGLSNFASESPSSKDERSRSPSSRHLSDRDVDYPSSHFRDQQDLDRDEAYVHEERDVDVDTGSTSQDSYFPHHSQEPSYRSEENGNDREGSSYRAQHDPTVTYYAEPPRQVYSDRRESNEHSSQSRNRSDDSSRPGFLRRAVSNLFSRDTRNRDDDYSYSRSNPRNQIHEHNRRDYRVRDPSRQIIRSSSSPYSSRNNRYTNEEEQRSESRFYPESRRSDTRENERFVDKYFRTSRCPRLRELTGSSGGVSTRGSSQWPSLDSYDDLSRQYSRQRSSMEDPSSLLMGRLYSDGSNKSMKKMHKRKLNQLRRQLEDPSLDELDFLQLLDMMDEEEHQIARLSSRLSSESPQRQKWQRKEMQDYEELAAFCPHLASKRQSSTAHFPLNKMVSLLALQDQEEEPSCSRLTKSKGTFADSRCNQKKSKSCIDEEEEDEELSCPKSTKSKSKSEKGSETGSKSGKKSSSKGSSKGGSKENSKAGKSKKQKK